MPAIGGVEHPRGLLTPDENRLAAHDDRVLFRAVARGDVGDPSRRALGDEHGRAAGQDLATAVMGADVRVSDACGGGHGRA